MVVDLATPQRDNRDRTSAYQRRRIVEEILPISRMMNEEKDNPSKTSPRVQKETNA